MGSKWTCPEPLRECGPFRIWTPAHPSIWAPTVWPYCHHHIFSRERPQLTFLALGLGCGKAGRKPSCRYGAAPAFSRFECCTRDHPLYLTSRGGKHAIEIQWDQLFPTSKLLLGTQWVTLPLGAQGAYILDARLVWVPGILWEGMQCPQHHRLVQQQTGTRESTFPYSPICYDGK